MGRPGTIRDKTSCCPFVPGQKYFLVPLSLSPGTRTGVKIPGHTSLSRDVPGQIYLWLSKKIVIKSQKLSKIFFFKICNFFTLFSFCSRFCPGTGQDGSGCQNPTHPVPCPVPDFDRLSQPVPARGKILSLSCCPFVPGQ